MPEAPVDREECVFMAKLAEQAERYDEMVEEVRKIAQMVTDQQLSVEERNLLSVAYKNVIGSRRASWRIVSSIEQKEESKGNVEHVERIQKYRAVVSRPFPALPFPPPSRFGRRPTSLSTAHTRILNVSATSPRARAWPCAVWLPRRKPPRLIVLEGFGVAAAGGFARLRRNEAGNKPLRLHLA